MIFALTFICKKILTTFHSGNIFTTLYVLDIENIHVLALTTIENVFLEALYKSNNKMENDLKQENK